MRAERLTKEVKSVVQAVRGLDIVRRYHPGKFGSVIVLGLQVLGFDLGRDNKESLAARIALMRALVGLQILLNDEVDFPSTVYAPTPKNQWKQEIESKEAEKWRDLRQAIRGLSMRIGPAPSEQVMVLLQNYLEIVRVREREFRIRHPVAPPTMDEVERYRTSVNNLSVMAVMCALFYPQHKEIFELVQQRPDELFSLDDPFVSIWLDEAKQANQTDQTEFWQAMAAMESLVMITQLIDDRLGWPVDRWLGVETMSTAARREMPAEADQVLRGLEGHFAHQAVRLGASRLSVVGLRLVAGFYWGMLQRSVSRAASCQIAPLSRWIVDTRAGRREQAFTAWMRGCGGRENDQALQIPS